MDLAQCNNYTKWDVTTQKIQLQNSSKGLLGIGKLGTFAKNIEILYYYIRKLQKISGT